MYAVDLTLWVNRGSNGHIDDILQNAIDEIERYLEPLGIKCSAEKSEPLFLIPNNNHRTGRNNYHIRLKAGGKPIPARDKIRVLGLYVQDSGRNAETIRRLDNAVAQIRRMLKHISTKHGGNEGG